MNSQLKLKGRNLIARKVKTMTNREFYNTIINHEITEDTITFAIEALAKLDARNSKRASTPSKTAVANAPVKESIAEFLRANPEQWYTSPEVGTAMELTTQKAGALLRQMVADEVVEVEDRKIPHKGMMKVYRIKR